MKASEIITVLNYFKDSSYQRVLINGNWGIGKTKYVLDFKEEYSNSCYISLFGKKGIDSIIQELYFRIIENTPKGSLKKYARIAREKLNNVSIRYNGVSISIPLIEDLHKTLYKELGKRETFIIIFDDLERKHDDLSIKEILGLLDSLSKIENIKTVLIAATDQLDDKNKEIFLNYQEKAIDRTYTIEKYSDEAPIEILGEQVWKVIGKLVENFKFNNLRTFEKTSSFIKEVIEVLREDVFTDKFTRDDVYRMCFATVFFKIEHQNEMKLLDTKNDKSGSMNAYLNAYYTENKSGEIEYLSNYILKNSLDNVMSKNVFYHIKIWYETGTYSRESIINLITSINNYEENPKNFFSSEQEILDVIKYSREYIRNLNGTERIEDIVSNLNTAFTWCEILSTDFGISNEEILDMIDTNISNSIDIKNTNYENTLDLWHFHIESEEARKVVNSINEVLKVQYCDKLLKRIKDCFNEGSYSNYSYLRQLADLIISTSDSQIKERILKGICDNKFFFPIPTGKITEDHWNWCHLIINLIATINKYWEIKNYYDEFKTYIYSLEITKEDKMLQHRLKQLFGNNQ